MHALSYVGRCPNLENYVCGPYAIVEEKLWMKRWSFVLNKKKVSQAKTFVNFSCMGVQRLRLQFYVSLVIALD
jgi:hypothetical protein